MLEKAEQGCHYSSPQLFFHLDLLHLKDHTRITYSEENKIIIRGRLVL